ncbi:MAG: NAD(P)/FAD-dependent oxidoreductase [Dehalococcoidia bacterium]|nr:NAD(P)/FAD-dependent oxidoreductase [Dehalococcoidia bacterium]
MTERSAGTAGAPDGNDAAVAIVGAGVVGLAVACALAPSHSVAVIERHEGPARETSSHNSGVIHAGIFYAAGSLKHRLCLEGNRALYDWCEARGVMVRRSGKLIVAIEPSEVDGLEVVLAQARANAVPGVSRLSGAQARAIEPAVPAVAALHSQSTGVVDAFGYARSLEAAAREAGVLFAYRHELTGVERAGGGTFRLALRGPDGAPAELRAAALVNCAGLRAHEVAAALGYSLDGAEGLPVLRQRVNRGRYYDVVSGPSARAVTRPIYPVPAHSGDLPAQLRSAGGLGVHITVDTDGAVHLGPDTEWLPEGAPLDYRADDSRRAAFLAAGQRLLPSLRDEEIAPGQVGYRPKLQRPGEEPADFLVWADRGYIHLGGIESPGLTCSLPLARMVAELLR